MSQIHTLPAASAAEAVKSALVLDTGAATKQFPVHDLPVNDLARKLAVYAGKNLASLYTPAKFQEKVQSGDFSGLELGDYFDITLTTGEVMRYIISGFNTYLNFGDNTNILTKNHVVMTPLDCMAATAQMNTTNDNTGGYAASLMPAHLETVFSTFPAAWQGLIHSTPRLENNKGAWAWASRKLFLLSETEVHGHPVWATDGYDGGTRPLPLFQFSARYRIKGLGFGKSAAGSRYAWWLASPSSANATYFCHCSYHGHSNSNGASYSIGVAPGFCI